MSSNETLKRLEQASEGTFWQWLGCRLIGWETSRTVVSLRVERRHLNHLGVLHGGVQSAVLDSAMGLACGKSRPDEPVVTTNLTVHYVSPMTEGDLIVEARLVHETRTIMTAESRLFAPDGRLISMATASYRVARRLPDPPARSPGSAGGKQQASVTADQKTTLAKSGEGDKGQRHE